jgi:two-component sensor histidine kinase
VSETQRRVLYVDDDEGLRNLVRRALERRGYAVALAASGEEGLAALDAGGFDLVALDHYMPGQGGFETLLQMRRRPDPPPIVYVTGSDESRVAVSALKAGASDYVVKTVGDEFFDLLESAFDQALAQVELRRRHAKAEADLVTSNLRLEALLREVNHRVANSLQLVSAFVQMQASAVEGEARAALKDTRRRIEAIIQVHQRLYSSQDVESVDMQDYLAALVRELQDTLSTAASPRHLSLVADEVRLTTDKAVSVGVIVNELITNACKYAYRRGEPGEVRIRLANEGAGLTLTVEDDGGGMAGDGVVRGTGLGGRLIKAMATSLNSEVRYDQAHAGVRAILRLPAI